jgi:hypothetical protein
MFLHSILTYFRLVPEAFMMHRHVLKEKLVRYTISFMATDAARRWAEHRSVALPFPFPTWVEFEQE